MHLFFQHNMLCKVPKIQKKMDRAHPTWCTALSKLYFWKPMDHCHGQNT